MRTVFHNGPILIEGALRDGMAVSVKHGMIEAVVPDLPRPEGEAVDLEGDILAPGFIDTQVNGGGGVLFNDTPTIETIAAIGAAHRRFGTTGFLPTLISDDLPIIVRAIEAVDQAIEHGVPGVLGIHIEGPFLNVERRGIHRADKIRPLDHEAVALLTRLKRGRTLVTLAPDMTSPEMIRTLVARGAIVAAGHTNASYAQMSAAIEAGLSGATHLFNAMSQLGSREAGTVGAILDSDRVTAGIIVDGRHVDPATLRVAIRARGSEALMLVTDAMPTVGGPREFVLQGKRIRVVDGVCVDDDGTLAGSDLDMARAVANTVTMLGQPLTAALAMASAVPAAFLGLGQRYGHIRAGAAASLVRLRPDLSVASTWITESRSSRATPSG
ncbi:N-acetylglucosamine-6-phosphate deacetylase [Sphingomonas tabacisoli]|uniref:N-acetylglucosamine-6-phosphate deacetylase n=1 Tax=Sphingomonas tabacisoli TaxID=2249466 RepID=A0ABW4I058_9SPHN